MNELSVRRRILSCLSKKSMTTDELAKELEVSRSTVVNTLKDLKKDKRICVESYAYTGVKPVTYWGVGSVDAPRPSPQTPEQRKAKKSAARKKAREEAKKLVQVPEFKPRRDIAASWF